MERASCGVDIIAVQKLSSKIASWLYVKKRRKIKDLLKNKVSLFNSKKSNFLEFLLSEWNNQDKLNTFNELNHSWIS